MKDSGRPLLIIDIVERQWLLWFVVARRHCSERPALSAAEQLALLTAGGILGALRADGK